MRHRLSRRKSRRMFKKGANRIHSINLRAVPMRGGFRI